MEADQRGWGGCKETQGATSSLVRGEMRLWGGWSSSCPPVSKGLWPLILEMNWDAVLGEKVCDLQMARHRCSQGASPSPYPVPILNLGPPFLKGD